MEELQDRLIKELEDLIEHLNIYEVKNWSSRFLKIKELIDNGNILGLESLKNMRGGMGSFNDLIICKANKHKINKNEEDFANQELMRLGSFVFTTAFKLNREFTKYNNEK